MLFANIPRSFQNARTSFSMAGYESLSVSSLNMILVLMNSTGVKVLTDPNLKLGVDVRATVGPKSAGDQANLKTDETPVLVYSDTRGAYGGASLQTGGVFPDSNNNEDYYGKKLTMSEIVVDGKVEPTEAAKLLAGKIEQYAKPATK